MAALRQIGRDIDLQSAAADAELRRMLDEVTPEVMVNVVDEVLVVQRGREVGHRMSDEQFQRYAEFERYLATLRTNAIIEWRNAELQKAYERGLAELQ